MVPYPHQYLTFIEGHEQSGKTTLLTALAAACVASNKRPMLIRATMESADWFKAHRDPGGILVENGLQVIGSLQFHAAMRGRPAPDMILIDDANSHPGDIVRDVADYLHLRHLTTQVVVVK